MPEEEAPAEKTRSPAAQLFGEFAPALVGFTDDVLFGQVWTRPELSPRDRSMITVASLVTSGATTQLVSHLALAKQVFGSAEGAD
jgi:4-carboxymuconolactone decarboxylase